MLHAFLLLALFLPRTVVKQYPKPDPACLYQWISDPPKIENRCETPLVVDMAYKNGLGVHTVLMKGDVWPLAAPPLKIFVCTFGQGVASTSADHMVHPGFKTNQYVCLSQELVFPAYQEPDITGQAQ